jgi:hypothetical protein
MSYPLYDSKRRREEEKKRRISIERDRVVKPGNSTW